MHPASRLLAALPFLCALACASAPQPVPGPTPTALTTAPPPQAPPPAPPPAQFDPRAWVAAQELANDCEADAYRMKAQNPETAWIALRACVEKQKFVRGPFVQMNTLVSRWEEELSTKPEAARVVARIIANRGGDVTGDLAATQRARAPIFSLAAALNQPAVYKGRYVLMRASIKDIKTDPKEAAATFVLAETSFHQSESMRDQKTIVSSSSYGGSSSGSGSLSGSYSSTSGSGSGRLDASGSSQYSGGSTHTTTFGGKAVYSNLVRETGRVALGRMPSADPFLQPGNEFVVLGRFDGTRQEENVGAVAVVSIVAYFRPAALMVE